MFELLETISTDEIINRRRGPNVNTTIAGTAVRIGDVNRAAFDSPEELATSALLLAAAYAEMGDFTVPYLEVTG